MKAAFCLVLFLSCYIGPALLAQEAPSGGVSASSSSASVPATPPCALSHERLYIVLGELLIDGLKLYVNCLSFNRNASLVSGVISGVNMSDPMTGGERLELRCEENYITGRPSQLPPSTENMNTTACLACSNQVSNICLGDCESPCERCFNDTTTTCSRCLACMAEPNECTLQVEGVYGVTHCQAECRETLEVEHEKFNACECPSGYHRQLINPMVSPKEPAEEEGNRTCNFFPELENFQCVKSCKIGNKVNENLNMCFACGLDYCLQCDNDTNVCEDCLLETQLFDHRCYACPLATVAEEANVQEEELKEEEREAKLRQIELAVTLPILCVGVALFFFLMSVFAHYRYPHLNPKGHKRHRVKPEDYTQSLDVAADPDFDTAPATVWRARPTVRLR